MKTILLSTAPGSIILIRLMVGLVFIPYPEFTASFVGIVEIVCGTLLVIGLLTRLAVVPLLIDISVAILTTKIPFLLHKGF